MFKGLANIASLMKQAQEMQGRMSEMQENLRRQHVEGSAGGGMVTVQMNGQQQMLACRIEPSLMQSGDREVIEDLTVAAVNQALERSKELATQELSKLTGGMNLPGMGDLMAKMGLGG